MVRYKTTKVIENLKYSNLKFKSTNNRIVTYYDSSLFTSGKVYMTLCFYI